MIEMSEDTKFDEVEFDKCMRQFFKVIDGIFDFKANDKFSLQSSGISGTKIQYNNYRRAYMDLTQPKEHVPGFQRFFAKHRIDILRGPDDDEWLKKGKSAFILFGEKESDNPKKRIKILLSSIYIDANRISEDTRKILEKADDEEFDKHKEIVFPEVLLLYLYRILCLCIEGDDRKKLEKHVEKLEETIGIRKKDTVEITPGLNNGLMGMANSLIKNMGVKPPPGSDASNGPDLGQLFGKLMSGEKMQDVTQKIMSGNIQDIDFNAVVGDLTKNMGSMAPEVEGALGKSSKGDTSKKSVESVSEIADAEEIIDTERIIIDENV